MPDLIAGLLGVHMQKLNAQTATPSHRVCGCQSRAHELPLLSSLLTSPSVSKRPPFSLGPSAAAAIIEALSSGAFLLRAF